MSTALREMRRLAAFAVLALAALVCADEEAGGGGKRRRRKRPGGAAAGKNADGQKPRRSPPSDAPAAPRRRPQAARGGKGGKRAGRPDPDAMIGLLKAYKEANGHVNVPLDHTAELEGREKPVRLGRWLAAVRKNAAKVKPERVAALDAVDASGAATNRACVRVAPLCSVSRMCDAGRRAAALGESVRSDAGDAQRACVTARCDETGGAGGGRPDAGATPPTGVLLADGRHALGRARLARGSARLRRRLHGLPGRRRVARAAGEGHGDLEDRRFWWGRVEPSASSSPTPHAAWMALAREPPSTPLE